MSKNKGYGYDRQDAVISKFRRDAKSRSKTSAVAQAIARGKKKKKKIEEIEEVRFSPKALIELSNG
jgi:hypothetical protein